MAIQFGDFVLDSARQELRRGTKSVALSPKAFQLLELLISERVRAVAKDEIRDRLWHGVFVSKASLPRVVNEVRTALSDDARRPVFVRTIHGFGYAFAGEVAENPQWPRNSVCRLVLGSRRIPLLEGQNVLGRAPDVAVPLASTRASRNHARIVVTGERAILEDLGSKNGTLLKGRKVEGPTELQDGDPIELGSVVLVFQRTAAYIDTTETD